MNGGDSPLVIWLMHIQKVSPWTLTWGRGCGALLGTRFHCDGPNTGFQI